MKRALVTGITGQDGSYLAEFLLGKDYEVYGVWRRSSTINTENLWGILNNPRLHLLYGDLLDQSSLDRIVEESKPDEVYNLGAQSQVRVSFDIPEYTAQVTGLGTLRLLEAVRKYAPRGCRFYQASTSELFGNAKAPQSELTNLEPRSPYSISKLFAHRMALNYLEAYGLFVSIGILFNHESPRRDISMVTRKIAAGAVSIAKGKMSSLYLGNVSALRDWGYAPEYVEGMWKMLQLPKPSILVLGTGETHTVKDFVEAAFQQAGLDYVQHVLYDKSLLRPSEVNELRADSTKAKELIGWNPKVKFRDLVRIMVKAELKRQA